MKYNNILFYFDVGVLDRHIWHQFDIFCRCGNADKDILSVYCLKGECQPKYIRDSPICGTRLPHDSHGCIDGSLIDWKKAHNVRNFSASINDHSACVWECKVFQLNIFDCFFSIFI